MNTRFYNGNVMTMASGAEIFPGELWVKGDAVAYAGAKKEADLPFDREIDLNGGLVMPGFKNAHTHSAMTFLRSYADDLPLLDWLHKQVFPMEAKLKPEDIYHLARLAILEYLSGGITANFDMYYHNAENARASTDMGFRTVLCGAVNDFGGTIENLEAEYLKFNAINPLISYRLGFHAEYTISEKLMRGDAELSRKYKAPVCTHNSEGRPEVEQCLERTGKTPTERMAELGLLEYGGAHFHCVHVSENDLSLYKDNGIYVVSNPSSNCKLASGIAPLCDFLEKGIPVALGTDGPASNNALDMFREMYLATVLQKLKKDDAAALPAESVLQMACVTGARAMGLDDCDCLSEGKKADLIVIDMNSPNMQPINNIAKNLVYAGGRQNVRLTMIGGEILYQGGEFLKADAGEIYAKANEIIKEMKRDGHKK